MKTLLSLFLLLSTAAHAARFIVEAKHPLNVSEMSQSSFKIEALSSAVNDYFSRTYVISGNVDQVSLRKLSWVKDVEPTMELNRLSLLPGKNSVALVEDELFSYQWGLFNQGQTFIREKDDIHNIPLLGTAGSDVGWGDLLPLLSSDKTIVAVLDSGVDLNHPELKDNLWKNKEECGKDSSLDHDGNKLPGDCHGWNFTEALDSPEAKSPQDNDGHGTHVAGIIAAAHDGKGIVGVAPHALILPVKVMKDSNSKSEIASSEAFARGIIYAVEKGASVINMSLGWPRSLETKYLREAVFYALSKGVVIVAAAGNNNSAEPLFPCAYEGVVCVAASTLDGSFAGFSNYGGHVDTIAPGEGILSLYPVLYEPDYFFVPGYELKSGTSQSAPFVSGLIAALKVQKEITLDEIFGRLYQAPSVKTNKKYINGGVAKWNSLSQEITKPVIRPILKRVRQLVLAGNSSEVKLSIPVKNYGKTSGKILLSVESLSPGIVIAQESFHLSSLKESEVTDIQATVKIADLTVESNFTFKIIIEEGGRKQSFINEIPVARDIRQDSRLEKFDFSFTDRALPVGMVKEGEVYTTLNSVSSIVASDKHEFYMKRSFQEGAKKILELTLFARQGNEYVQRPRSLRVEDGTHLVNFVRLDLDFDGKEDYLLQSLAGPEDKKYLLFSFYNSDGEALWPDFQNVPVTLDLYIESMNHLQFIKYQDKKLGTMMVPAFFTQGQLPKIDQVISSWDRYDAGKTPHLYFLEPMENKTFRVRSLTTNIWKQNLLKTLNLKWYETIQVEQLLPTSATDAVKGEVRVLVSAGHLNRRQIFIHKFQASHSLAGKALPQLVLQSDKIDPVYSMGPSGLSFVGEIFLNVYDRSRAKLVMTKNLEQEGQFVYRHESETDLIAGHIASFEQEGKHFSVLQTRDELIALNSSDRGIKKSTRPKLRYSFLTSKLLSEMYYPVFYKRGEHSAPALYVDSTAVTGNRVYLFEEQDGALVSSVKNSLIVPGNCKALNPTYGTQAATYQFVFLCLENRAWSLKTLPME
jgi:cell wall-associated protease